jgi:tRNA(Ile)-lysidine synthase
VPAAVEAPLAAAEFAAALAPFGPFEAAPHLAVAVSGGADSMALALLANAWARRRGGRVTGLIVDHGLRPESADEARRVATWLRARAIAPQILSWHGDKPVADIQAAARAARYALLAGWCRRHGVLHLLLAHHRDDQAETLLLNLARGAGVDGLAAMPPVAARNGVRLLRPLLTTPKFRLVAILRAARQAWIEDPSNAAPRFRRTAARQLSAEALASLAPGEVSAERLGERLAATAGRMARARAVLDAATAALLATAVEVSPHGYAVLDAGAVRRAPEEIALRALARVVACVSGGSYPPRLDGLSRVLRGLGQAATFAGCQLAPGRGGLLVWRESAAVGDAVTLRAGAWTVWDGRFRVRATRAGCRVAALGAARVESAITIPRAVRPSLPALWDASGLAAVPALGFRRRGAAALAALFRPPRPLVPLANDPVHTM